MSWQASGEEKTPFSATSAPAPAVMALAAPSAPAMLSAYAERISRLRNIYAAADTEALNQYKEEFPQFWRQDAAALCADVAPAVLLAPAFSVDAVAFVEALAARFAPVPTEDSCTLTLQAAEQTATECVEWLCAQPRPKLSRSRSVTHAYVEQQYNDFTASVSRRCSIAEQRALWPGIAWIRHYCSVYPNDFFSVEILLQLFPMIFDCLLCELFVTAQKGQHQCGAKGLLCRVNTASERSPNDCAGGGAFNKCSFEHFASNYGPLWFILEKMPAPVLNAVVPWLLLLNAPMPVLKAAANAAAVGAKNPQVYKLFSRLDPAFAQGPLKLLAHSIASSTLWAPAPTGAAWEDARRLVEYFAGPVKADPAARFLVFTMATLRGHAAAGHILEGFRQTRAERFGFDAPRWEFSPSAVSAGALPQLVAAAGLLYDSGCQQPAGFIAAVARCLRDHPAQTPVLKAVMDQFDNFSWTPSSPSAPGAKPGAKPASTALERENGGRRGCFC